MRCTVPHTHTSTEMFSCCLFFMLPYFTQRQVCRYMVSITLILPHCCSPDHINTNLEQAQGSMRPELCWNQAQDFHHHQGDSFIIYHAWWVTLIITLQTGLQLTARIARVMRSHTSDIDKYDLGYHWRYCYALLHCTYLKTTNTHFSLVL